jgi:hypothetical protein
MTKLLKNIALITLTVLFFIINTGFTVSLHFCSMEEKASLTSCGMCEAPIAADDPTNADCSDEESTSDELVFSSIPQKCCEVKLGAITGTDEYLINQFGTTVKAVHADLISFTYQENEYLASFSTKFISDSSPPTETTPRLFLSNRNFRI